MIRLAKWLLTVLGWDGVLPLLGALFPMWVRATFPRGDMMEVVAFVLAPLFAALARAMVGNVQLERLCGGARPFDRQLAFGLAIVLLMAFEAGSAMLIMVPGGPPNGWAALTTVYVVYLLFVCWALRPARVRLRPVT